MSDFTPRSTTTALVFGRDWLDSMRVERWGDNLFRRLGGSPDTRPVPMLRPFDVIAHKVTMTPSDRCQLIRVDWEPDEDLRKGAIFQVILLGPGARLIDVIRHDTMFSPEGGNGSFRRTIACRGVKDVVFVSASRDAEGSFTLGLSRPRQSSVLMATSWNCPSGRFLTSDPRENEWNWMSHDLEVVHDFTQMQNGQPKRLIRLAVQNIGPREAVLWRASVSFSWKPWKKESEDAWRPLGEAQISSLGSVEAYERERRGDRLSEDARWFGRRFVSVDAPSADPDKDPYIIRAVLRSSDDARDHPLVVLGSSKPMSQKSIESYGRSLRVGTPDPLPPPEHGCRRRAAS